MILILVLAALLAVGAGIAGAETVQKGNLRVSFTGAIAPHDLPRGGTAPIAVTLSGEIGTTDGRDPPQLRTIGLAINRKGRLDYKGLPRCSFHQIQPATMAEALSSCKRSLVGMGTFKAHVALPEQSPFPSNGRILAFNGTLDGKPVIYAHIYGTRPLPQSFVLAFHLRTGNFPTWPPSGASSAASRSPSGAASPTTIGAIATSAPAARPRRIPRRDLRLRPRLLRLRRR
jgi:hypothetical protein